MSRICPLFSGSSGNSTYIASQSGAVLVDAGASFKRLSAAVANAKGCIDEIAAVLITHEHIDHIRGLKALLNGTNASVIASCETLEALISADKIPPNTKTLAIDSGERLQILGMEITRFATSHDCAGSSGYTFLLPDNRKVSVCTDLGVVTDEVRKALIGSDAVLLESNHDIEMLKSGPYPNVLKMRIMSDTGHISNNACAAELPFLLKNGTKRFILGHLSKNNNTPMLALSCAEAALIDTGAENGRDYILTVAAPSDNRVTVI